jgi:hypothetical protein
MQRCAQIGMHTRRDSGEGFDRGSDGALRRSVQQRHGRYTRPRPLERGRRWRVQWPHRSSLVCRPLLRACGWVSDVMLLVLRFELLPSALERLIRMFAWKSVKASWKRKEARWRPDQCCRHVGRKEGATQACSRHPSNQDAPQASHSDTHKSETAIDHSLDVSCFTVESAIINLHECVSLGTYRWRRVEIKSLVVRLWGG